MSDPQQIPTPPYASNAQPPAQSWQPQQPQQIPTPPYASNAQPPAQPQQPQHPGQAGQHPPYSQGQFAQPQFTQPQHSQSQYAQPAYPSGPAGAPGAPGAVGASGGVGAPGGAGSNTPGRIGFIIGLVGLGLSLLPSVIVQMMIRSADYQLISLVSGVLSVIVFLTAAAALVLGIIGLRRAGEPHGLAGIATGLGGAGVIGIAFNFFVTAIGSAFYF